MEFPTPEVRPSQTRPFWSSAQLRPILDCWLLNCSWGQKGTRASASEVRCHRRSGADVGQAPAGKRTDRFLEPTPSQAPVRLIRRAMEGPNMQKGLPSSAPRAALGSSPARHQSQLGPLATCQKVHWEKTCTSEKTLTNHCTRRHDGTRINRQRRESVPKGKRPRSGFVRVVVSRTTPDTPCRFASCAQWRKRPLSAVRAQPKRHNMLPAGGRTPQAKKGPRARTACAARRYRPHTASYP